MQHDINNLLGMCGLESLDPIAKSVLGDSHASVSRPPTLRSLDGLSMGPGTESLLRIFGEASTSAGSSRWSVVVKILHIDPDNRHGLLGMPANEVAAYESTDRLSGTPGMRSARCFRIDRFAGNRVALWIEDLSDWSGPPWSSEQYAEAANAIGRFSGYWATQSEIPFQDLAEHVGLDRFTLANLGGVVLAESESEVLKFLKTYLSAETWDCVQLFVAAIDKGRSNRRSTSHTLVHGDCHPRNLFLPPDSLKSDELVAIDWGGMALGPIAFDIGTMVGSGMSWGENEFELLLVSEPACWHAFASGLKEARWTGQLVRVRDEYLTTLCGYALFFASLPATLRSHHSYHDFFLARSGEASTEDAAESYGRRAIALRHYAEELLSSR